MGAMPVWPHAANLPLLSGTAAGGAPLGHPLAERGAVDWDARAARIILGSGMDDK